MQRLIRALMLAILGMFVPAELGRHFLAAEPRSSTVARKAEAPPRKVVVGTAIFFPGGEYPGVGERIKVLSSIVEKMAREAGRKYPGDRLDLAVLPESALTATTGLASERATALDRSLAETLGGIARAHRSYLVVPMDLAETRDGASILSNAAVLFDREGRVAGIYRKAHPVAPVGTDVLERGITPGRGFPVFDCDFGKLGIQICWDMQFDDGWQALADEGAELVVWPSASPAKTLPAARSARNRYYLVSSTWRDNATVYEPTGMVAARIGPPETVLVHRLDLSFAVLGWSDFLNNGNALREKFGERVDFHYDPSEDLGLFWSNDPLTPIGTMVRSIGGELIDQQVERNRKLHTRANQD